VEVPVGALHVATRKQKNGVTRVDIGQLQGKHAIDRGVVRIVTDLQRMRTIDIPIELLP
ncbi:MAG: hypothetical protein HON70_39230, partial [Lentisphaerae bacterium]|nr:hypothetical protein [Lentisphaerota bacterium]